MDTSEHERLATERYKAKCVALAVGLPLAILAAAAWFAVLGRESVREQQPAATTVTTIARPEATSDASKRELLGLLAAHPGREAVILAYWKALYPQSDWLRPLERVIAERERSTLANARSKTQHLALKPKPHDEESASPPAGSYEGQNSALEVPLPASPPQPQSAFVPR